MASIFESGHLPAEAVIRACDLVPGTLVRWEGVELEVRKIAPKGMRLWVWLDAPGCTWELDDEPTLSVGRNHRFERVNLEVASAMLGRILGGDR